MLADLEALVKLESPTEDLQACQDVIKLASDIEQKFLELLQKFVMSTAVQFFGGAQVILT
jgi:hypothetical protein